MSRRQPFVDFFFFATIATVTFEKIHWSVGERPRALRRADGALPDRVRAQPARASRRPVHPLRRDHVRVLPRLPRRLPARLLQPRDGRRARAVGEGDGQVPAPLPVPRSPPSRSSRGAASGTSGGRSASSAAASRRTRSTASLQLGVAQTTGGNLDATVLSPITGGASQINIYGAVEGASVYRPNALTGDPNHLAIELLVPLLVLLPDLPPARARQPVPRAADGDADVPARDRARDVLAQRPARALLRPARARRPVPPPLPARRGSSRRSAPSFLILLVLVAQRASFFETVIKSRVDTSGKGTSTHFSVYEFIPHVLSQHPLFGLGLNNFSVYYEFVTGPQQLRAALVLRRAVRRERRRRGAALRRVPRLPLLPALGRPRRSAARCRRPATSSRRACGRWSGG